MRQNQTPVLQRLHLPTTVPHLLLENHDELEMRRTTKSQKLPEQNESDRKQLQSETLESDSLHRMTDSLETKQMICTRMYMCTYAEIETKSVGNTYRYLLNFGIEYAKVKKGEK